MGSIARKVRRTQMKKEGKLGPLNRPKTKVDLFNEELIESAGENATHYTQLHPTKGFRKMSLKDLKPASKELWGCGSEWL